MESLGIAGGPFEIHESGYRAAMGRLEEGVVAVDADYRFAIVNPAAAAIYGTTPEQMLGRRVADFCPPEARAKLDEQMRLRRGGTADTYEIDIVRPSGERRTILVSSAPQMGAGGRFLGTVAVFRDVSDAKGMEREIRLLGHALRSTSECVSITDPNNRILFVNSAFLRTYGYSEGDLLGQPIEMVRAPMNDPEAVAKILPETLAGGWEGEVWNRRKDGSVFPIHLSASVLKDDAGQIVATVGVARDIGRRKRAEADMALNAARLEALVRLGQMQDASEDEITEFALEEGVRLTGSQYGYLVFVSENESVLTMHSWSKAATAECRVAEFQREYKVDDTGLWGEPVRKRCPVINNDYSAPDPVKRGLPQGHIPLRRHMGVPLIDGGRTVAITGVANKEEPYNDSDLRQLTLLMDGMWKLLQRKRNEAAIEEARRAAETASEAKSQFLANMSHEIRTPMNGILGMVSLMLDTNLSAAQKEIADAIRVSADSLLTVINDILDFSRLEAGKVRIEPAPFDLEEAIEQVLELMAPRAEAKGVELALRFDHRAVSRVVGDAGRIRQVLVNLMGNAVKFTDRGHVLVEVSQVSRLDGRVCCQIAVHDTGIGIPAEKLSEVFREFTQVDLSSTRRFEGAGLGLAISKNLVELMQGRIHIASQMGVGSSFTIELPLAPDKDSPERTWLVHGPGLTRVLVVSGRPVTRRAVAELCRGWGIQAVEAGDPLEMLAILREEASAGRHPEAAILDCASLPDCQADHLWREVADKRIPTVCLVLSSRRSSERPASCRRNCHRVTLPVKRARLSEALRQAVQHRPAETDEVIGGQAVEPSEQPFRGLRALLAEDNLINQKVGSKMLERLGFEVSVATNGAEAAALTLRERYDVVLMDCQMPLVDGMEATRRIRSGEPPAERTPVVALTARAMEGDREACLRAGMDAYISKPVQAEELLRVLEQCVRAERRSRVSAV